MYKINKRLVFKAALFLLIVFCGLVLPFIGGMYASNTVQASAYSYDDDSYDIIKVHSYQVDVSVRKDRKVEVKEKIKVEFLASGLTMFYRSLPIESTRYTNVVASCAGNDEFFYTVEDNPDMSGFIDVNCVGGAQRGNVWTYDISYTMEQDGNEKENGMYIDVIGYGWSVPLNDVLITVHFPTAVEKESLELYSGGYGASGNDANVMMQLFSDKKTLSLWVERLEVVYNGYYGEEMAQGITLGFELGKGVLQDYANTRIFTDGMWKIVIGVAIAIGLGLLVALFAPSKKEIITTVNIKAPDQMDPMKMGKLIDGTVDNEDVTSMLYYFAHKGYLLIDLTNDDDPRFIQKVSVLPETESVHARTLFNGLFARADREVIAGKTPFDDDTVIVSTRVSRLKHKFYETADKAIKQTPNVKMYEPKSVLWYVLGGVLGLLCGLILPLVLSFAVGGGYTYFGGGVFFVPIVAILIFGLLKENYRYKWKRSALLGMTAAQVGLATLFALIFIACFASHVLTGPEKAVVCLGALLPTFFTLGKLSRTEKYRQTLGQILGFKDFIVVTEEEKIEFMLK